MKKRLWMAVGPLGIFLIACSGGGGSGASALATGSASPLSPVSQSDPAGGATAVSASTPASEAPAVIPGPTVYPAAGGSDQTDTLQQTLDGLQPGQGMVFAPGQYIVSRSLQVTTPGVVISGYGATLVSTNASDQAIVMSGAGSTLVGLTLVGTGTTRLTTPASAKVEVTGSNIQVLGVTIRGGASAGIFVFGGTDVAVVDNNVTSTLADGIHMTYGSHNVLVQGNTVTGTGDDMVAVVSYQGDGALSSNVLITGNALSGNPWGRGVSVVGGADVTITQNTVQGVQKAAGVLVAQEDSYQTYGATNVLVTDNVISDIENSAHPSNTLPAAQEAAIDLNTGSGSVTLVSVTGNQVSRSNYAGFRALGNVCQFFVSGNAFESIAGTPVSLLSTGCAPSQSIVGVNTLFGVALAAPAGSSESGTLNVTGADVSLLPKVRAYLMQPAS
jgi:hypothetical protein